VAAGVEEAVRRAVDRAEVRRRAVPVERPLREAGLAALRDDAGLAVLRDDAGLAVLRDDAGLAVLREADLAVLREAGFEAEERLAVPRLLADDRLAVEELLLAAELRVPEPRELAGFEAALERAPPLAFRVLLARGLDAARLGALPLRADPVVRFDELDFGCGICSLPSGATDVARLPEIASNASQAGFAA
jgi:hypothetical protein